MKLIKLLENVEITDIRGIENLNGIDIEGISSNSKNIKKNYIFIALRGERFDGHSFIEEALKNGAIVILGDRDIDKDIPYIKVTNSKKAYAFLSSNFYGNPYKYIRTIGVTGTNGKTTTVNLIGKILETGGDKIGIIGTLGARLGDEALPTNFTTPEQLLLAELYNKAKILGIKRIVMEVSSHALAQHRVDAVCFEGSVFTNLTQDHLDFHKDMESYFSAKRYLFEMVSKVEDGIMVINIDDPYGKRLISEFREKCPVTYGINEPAMVTARNIEVYPNGLSFDLLLEGKSFKVQSKLLGEVNVYNILSAVGYCYRVGIPIDKILKVISEFSPVRGRLESVDLGQPFQVLIDYAHTPDALERVIKVSKSLGRRVIVVFGCGGDRDKTKRPIMGDIATRLSDFVIITSDNPRSEDPRKIIEDIVSGVKKSNYIIQEDRKEAIFYAINMAEPGDVVVIAGKGHETYQIFKDVTIHFDDREVAMEAIKRRINDKH
ncbi:MAG: UDP-N-acetylmuramoyl-L-alanyl-D-glutamate--2,6-diaminopimelate ligase [bacterium]|nr:UDP-N-acetylmuramoyl-L-alanyl-D-glutamate--2,6-diaminopimelate ligase [bacterium]